MDRGHNITLPAQYYDKDGYMDSTQNAPDVLEINGTALQNHQITQPVADAMCEAASVCLQEHHNPPHPFVVHVNDKLHKADLVWTIPTSIVKSSHSYINDAVKDGAYAVSLRCAERYLGLITTGQAEAGSGADWYLVPKGTHIVSDGFPDLDSTESYRFEVSGTSESTVNYRAKQKEQQIRLGKSAIPGIISIVGFKVAKVVIKHITSREGGAANDKV